MTGDSDWVVVLSTFNQGDIALAKHILAREDIVHVVQGTQNYPMVSPVRLIVRKEEAQEATELLEGLELLVLDDFSRCDLPEGLKGLPANP